MGAVHDTESRSPRRLRSRDLAQFDREDAVDTGFQALPDGLKKKDRRRWLDCERRMATWYFDEEEVAALEKAPCVRLTAFPDLVRLLRDVMSEQDAERLVLSWIENDRLTPVHPVVGLPDLDDREQLSGTAFPSSEVDRLLESVTRETGLTLDKELTSPTGNSAARRAPGGDGAGRVAAYQSTTHHLLGRDDILRGVINRAIEKAGSRERSKVFLALRDLAVEGVAPFTGEVSKEGLQYTAMKNVVRTFTTDALRKRLERSKRKG